MEKITCPACTKGYITARGQREQTRRIRCSYCFGDGLLDADLAARYHTANRMDAITCSITGDALCAGLTEIVQEAGRRMWKRDPMRYRAIYGDSSPAVHAIVIFDRDLDPNPGLAWARPEDNLTP